MANEIPPVDPALVLTDSPNRSKHVERLEEQLLEAETASLKLANTEKNQRLRMRWIAVAVGVIVIFVMLGGFVHAAHQLTKPSYFEPTTGVILALVATPVFSVTTLAGALFVAAFGKFRERELGAAAKGVGGLVDKIPGG